MLTDWLPCAVSSACLAGNRAHERRTDMFLFFLYASWCYKCCSMLKMKSAREQLGCPRSGSEEARLRGYRAGWAGGQADGGNEGAENRAKGPRGKGQG